MALRRRVVASLLCASFCASIALAQAPQARVKWPEVQSRVPRDPALEARLERVKAKLIGFVTPQEAVK